MGLGDEGKRGKKNLGIVRVRGRGRGVVQFHARLESSRHVRVCNVAMVEESLELIRLVLSIKFSSGKMRHSSFGSFWKFSV